MDNGFGFLIFVGTIILGLSAGFEYGKPVGFAVIAIGFIIMGGAGAMLNYLDSNRRG